MVERVNEGIAFDVWLLKGGVESYLLAPDEFRKRSGIGKSGEEGATSLLQGEDCQNWSHHSSFMAMHGT